MTDTVDVSDPHTYQPAAGSFLFDLYVDAAGFLLNVNILATLFLLATVLSCRYVLMRVVTSKVSDDIGHRRYAITSRNVAGLITIAGLLVIWAPVLQSALLSLAAFAVAIVIATKEVLLCIIGGFVRAADNEYAVGDIIVIGDRRGEVVDITPFAVKIHELTGCRRGDEMTGRITTIPHSVVLAQAISVDTVARYIVDEDLRFPVEHSDDALALKEILASLAFDATQEARERGQAMIRLIRQKIGIREFVLPDPRVTLTPGIRRHVLQLSMRIPAPSRAQIVDEITTGFLEAQSKLRSAADLTIRSPDGGRQSERLNPPLM